MPIGIITLGQSSGMNSRLSSRSSRARRASLWVAGGIGFMAGAYATYVGITWYRYGRIADPSSPDEADSLLDSFMPQYEVVERHCVRVSAPAEITLSAATDMDLLGSPIVRAIVRARELVLGAEPVAVARPKGLLNEVTAMGWGVLAQLPGREIVVGAVTQPWLPNVVFRALPPGEFAAFREPGYVKIAWTLRADPSGPGESMFRTETRAQTTDPVARSRFRWYWARFSPGITVIRRVMLGPLKAEAESRFTGGQPFRTPETSSAK
jgi:hypothetical protein